LLSDVFLPIIFWLSVGRVVYHVFSLVTYFFYELFIKLPDLSCSWNSSDRQTFIVRWC